MVRIDQYKHSPFKACEGNRPTRNREKATTNQSRLQWKFYTSPKIYHIITKP